MKFNQRMKASAIVLLIMALSTSCASSKPVTPVAQAAGTETVADKVHGDCNMCHQSHKGSAGVLLQKPVSKLCRSCHPQKEGRMEHKVGIVPSMSVDDLPLDAEGRITCITCHDPHEKEGFPNLLRIKDNNEICMRCHKLH